MIELNIGVIEPKKIKMKDIILENVETGERHSIFSEKVCSFIIHDYDNNVCVSSYSKRQINKINNNTVNLPCSTVSHDKYISDKLQFIEIHDYSDKLKIGDILEIYTFPSELNGFSNNDEILNSQHDSYTTYYKVHIL